MIHSFQSSSVTDVSVFHWKEIDAIVIDSISQSLSNLWLLPRQTRHINHPSTLETLDLLFPPLLFTPILSPEKAMYDLRAHVITRSSDRQFMLKFLQVEVQKSDAMCSHSSAARRVHRFLHLQQFGEETVKHRAMRNKVSPE
jgi:hypothetical protein